MNLNTVNVVNLQQYNNHIHTLLSNNPKGLWFRGVGCSTYDLSPSILRQPSIATAADMQEMENNLLRRFEERSIPYLAQRIEDPWERLFLMQHYGVPTRLLDWTESPSIALFFALTSANPNQTTDCTVWTLCPYKLNRATFSHLGSTSANSGARSVNDPVIQGYKPGNISNAHPAAIYGIHNSPRIVAQRGSFTVQGNDLTPINQIYSASTTWPQDTITRIDIPHSSIKPILNMLVNTGITDASIYPDLGGLAKEIRRKFGYEV